MTTETQTINNMLFIQHIKERRIFKIFSDDKAESIEFIAEYVSSTKQHDKCKSFKRK